MSELRGCPFCGREPIIMKISRYSRRHLIKCTGCKVQPEARGKEKSLAVSAWNSRAESTVTEETNRLLNLECEELKKDIESMKSAIEGAMRISDLWLPKGSFSDNPPENYVELEALSIMARNFQRILDK